MHHRGPDDSGVYADRGVALGMARLAILDLSQAAHQPMRSDDGRYVLIYNGETYNFAEERRALESRGHRFRTTGDTEVVLHLFTEHGKDCLRHMRGMFAFAVWDTLEQTVFLARDRLGIKPLYLYQTPGRLVFGSELKTLIASGLVPRELDLRGLQQLLSLGSIQPPRTLVSGVRALLPGHAAIYQRGELSTFQYWDVDAARATRSVHGLSFEDATALVREKLEESVRLRVRSDVPLGTFLSAGVDSAAIVGLMRRIGIERVKTFTIGFESSPGAVDETREAEETARHFATDHTVQTVSDADAVRELDAFASALDQPSIDGLNTYLVSKLAREQVTVSLCGLGADELYAGYSRTWQIHWQSALPDLARRKLAHQLWSLAAARGGLRMLPRAVCSRIEAYCSPGDPLASYTHLRRVIPRAELRTLVTRDAAIEMRLDDEPAAELSPFDDPSLLDPVTRVSRLDLKTFLPAQLLRDMDAVSMAHSLEVRFPLIDHQLVELSFALPADFKYSPATRPRGLMHGSETYSRSGAKRIFLAALADDLPPGITDRKKSGFLLPYARWLRGDLAPRARHAIHALSERPQGIFDARGLSAFAARFAQGGASWPSMWVLMILDAWLNDVLGTTTSARFRAA
jgi:asparagine synthase (glutamine-hydrolysing)